MVPGASTLWVRTWGFPPYGALAGELNFGNKAVNQCGSLSQGKNDLLQARKRFIAGLERLVRRRFRSDQLFQPRFFVRSQFEQGLIFCGRGFRAPPAVYPKRQPASGQRQRRQQP